MYTTHRLVSTDGRTWPNGILAGFNGFDRPMDGCRRSESRV
jgi:hypothetical protein